MSYGIKIHNENGDVQVDGEYSNYMLTGTGTVTPFYSDAYHDAMFSFPDYGDIPIIGIKPTSKGAAIATTNSTTSAFCISSSSNYNLDCARNFYTTPITYAIFNKAKPIPLSGKYGIAIYNSSGDIVFDSERKWMRIISSNTVRLYRAPVYGPTSAVLNVVNADANYFAISPNLVGILFERPSYGLSAITPYRVMISKKNSTQIGVYFGGTFRSRCDGEGQNYYVGHKYGDITVIELNYT